MKKGTKVRTLHLDENVEGAVLEVLEAVPIPVGDGISDVVVEVDGNPIVYDASVLEPIS